MKAIDKEVYDFIVRYKRCNDGLAPTLSEIRSTLRLSSNGVVRNSLARLDMEGLIVLIPNKAAGIKVVRGCWSLGSEEKVGYSVAPQ